MRTLKVLVELYPTRKSLSRHRLLVKIETISMTLFDPRASDKLFSMNFLLSVSNNNPPESVIVCFSNMFCFEE